jgi:hypothetical protein
VRCKRCGQTLLLYSEQELALCSTCQEVLRRPPLIETAFERTNNETSYLYAMEIESLPPYAASSPSPPRLLRPVGVAQRDVDRPHALSQPSRPHPLRPDGTLIFLTVLTIFGTLGAVWYLRPHLIGFNSLDVLVVIGVGCLWWWWWKTLCQREGEGTNGH